MADVVAVLGLVAAAGVAILAVAFVGAVLLRVSASRSSTERPVMPSHYSSLLATDPSKYPGYCPECGTNNDPQYEVCRNCSSRLPAGRDPRPDRDVESIFEP